MKEVITMRMSYRQYKQHYSDCKAHDYNASGKTIEVDIPYGRMKNSGVRGKKYDTFTFAVWFTGKCQ